jgi:hypothetical protein
MSARRSSPWPRPRSPASDPRLASASAISTARYLRQIRMGRSARCQVGSLRMLRHVQTVEVNGPVPIAWWRFLLMAVLFIGDLLRRAGHRDPARHTSDRVSACRAPGCRARCLCGEVAEESTWRRLWSPCVPQPSPPLDVRGPVVRVRSWRPRTCLVPSVSSRLPGVAVSRTGVHDSRCGHSCVDDGKASRARSGVGEPLADVTALRQISALSRWAGHLVDHGEAGRADAVTSENFKASRSCVPSAA